MIEAGITLKGRYEIRERIAKGGFATVYRAWDTTFERWVAIKVVDLAEDDDGQPLNAQELLKEARSIATNRHPNIIDVYDLGEIEHQTYLIMPYADGGNLYQLMKAVGPFSYEQTGKYLQQIASALDYAHHLKIIHRDLKPQNFLLFGTDKQHLMISDFGVSKIVSQNAAISNTRIIGTPRYMSPEQFEGKVSYRSDIYALGVILYQMLAGEAPFRGDYITIRDSHLHQSPPFLSLKRTNCSPALDQLIQRTMSKDPAQRPQTALEVSQAYQQIIAQLPSSATDVTETSRLSPLPADPTPTPTPGALYVVQPPPSDVPTPQHNTPSYLKQPSPFAPVNSTPPVTNDAMVTPDPSKVKAPPLISNKFPAERNSRRKTFWLIGLLALLTFLIVGGIVIFNLVGTSTPTGNSPIALGISTATPPISTRAAAIATAANTPTVTNNLALTTPSATILPTVTAGPTVDPDEIFTQANDAFGKQDWETAIRLLDDLASKNYNPEKINSLLGEAVCGYGKKLVGDVNVAIPSSLDMLKRCIEVRGVTDEVKALQERLNTYLNIKSLISQNKLAEVIPLLEQSYSADNSFRDVKDLLRDAYLNYATDFISQGKQPEAIESLEKLYKLDKGYKNVEAVLFDTYFTVGKSFIDQKNWGAGFPMLEKLYGLKKDYNGVGSTLFFAYLAYTDELFNAQQYPQALETCYKARDLEFGGNREQADGRCNEVSKPLTPTVAPTIVYIPPTPIPATPTPRPQPPTPTPVPPTPTPRPPTPPPPPPTVCLIINGKQVCG